MKKSSVAPRENFIRGSRNILLPVTSLLVLVAMPPSGCKKNSDGNYSNSKGCITRNVTKAGDILLDAADYDTARRLFAANNISPDSLQPYRVYKDGPDSSGSFVSIYWATQYVNNLPLNTGIIELRFYKGQLWDSIYRLPGTPENTDTSGHLSLQQVRKIFLTKDF